MDAHGAVRVIVQEIPFAWLSFLGVLSAGFALLFSAAGLRQAHRATKYQKIVQLLEDRYSDDMRLAKAALRSWYDNPNRRKQIQAGRDFDKRRKAFIAYFQKILDLATSGLLSKRDIMALVNRSDLVLLLCASKPIERDVHSKLLLDCDQLPAQCRRRRRKKVDLFAFFEDYHRRGYT